MNLFGTSLGQIIFVIYLCYFTMTTIDLRQSVLVYTPENTQFDFWLTLNYHKQLGIEKTSTKPYTNLAPTGKNSTYIIKLLTVIYNDP